MDVPILCLVVVSFLLWVLLLQNRIKELSKETRKLKGLLKLDIQDRTADVEITKGRRLWGRQVGDSQKHAAHIIRS